MSVRMIDLLPALYERDETAWLEAMAELARDGWAEDLDLGHLAEYLFDRARRDRREVESRLAVLLSHLLKWTDQPDHRSRGWRATVIEQRQELNRLAGPGVLRNHAQEVLADVYTARPIGRNQIGRLDRLRNTKRLRALQFCPV
ncbi:MAG: DUF29 domain-containing protein [Isosphaeraceae bacterium]